MKDRTGGSMSLLSEIREVGTAIRLGGEFAKFFDGVRIEGLPSEPMVQVVSCSRSERAPGYRFVRYSYSVKARSTSGIETTGYGESDSKFVAIQKAIAEAVERVTMLEAAKLDPTVRTSNGWAAHVTKARAEASARWELLERDTALVIWFSKLGYATLRQDELPARVRRFVRDELSLAPRYDQLRVLTGFVGDAPLVGVMLHDSERKGFISFASGFDLDRAIEGALAEACRMADLHAKGLVVHSSPEKAFETPDDHALFYAEAYPFPEFFFYGAEMGYRSDLRYWARKSRRASSVSGFSFEHFRCGPLFIARARNSALQDLFFGYSHTAIEDGSVNVKRIESLTSAGRILNTLPHCVA